MITFMSHPKLSTLPDSFSRTKSYQKGFTLLEMVLVLFLIGLLASAGLLFTEGVEDQAKYDETKRRIELIRKAIIGDTTRTINGAPEISGFAADTGRLPACIAELFYLDTENPISGVAADLYRSPCDTSNVTDLPLPYWFMNQTTGIGFGWRGPYIQTLTDRNGEVRFRDGYGNDDDTENFGWQWQLFDKNDNSLNVTEAKSAVKASLQSLGFDAIDPVDDIPKGDISAIPSLIVNNDWKVTLPNTITVNFQNQSSVKALPESDLQLLLRLYSFEFADYIDVTDGINVALTLAQSEVPELMTRTKSFVLPDTKEISMGQRTYAVVCYEVPAGDTDEYVIFDGDCDPTTGLVPETGNIKPDSSTVRTFTVVPRNSLNLQLDWIIPTP